MPTSPRSGRSPTERYLDPELLMKIRSLELRARTVVDGVLAGLHRSPYHGFSAEFSEYREYTPGDDLRYLDWRLFARSDRYYVKRFEDETNRRAWLLVDNSRSMDFGSLDWTKAEFARTLAASLAWLLLRQRDAVGVVTFDETCREQVPPRFRPGQLRRLLVALDRPVAGTATNLSSPLEQIARQVTRRGLLVLFSDLLAPIDRLETDLGLLAARGHDLVVLQVLDPLELDLELPAAVRLRDSESRHELDVDPATARRAWHDGLQRHLERIRSACDRHGVAYHRVATDRPLERVLLEVLVGKSIEPVAEGPGRRMA